MSITLRKSSENLYEAVSITDTEEIGLSNVSLADNTVSLNGREHRAKISEVVKVGSLSRNTYSSWYFISRGAIDAALAFGPVFFFVLAGLCLALNGKSISTNGEKIRSITLLSPTIFPIIYAAILGKFLRRVGLYKAERGATIGDLERLIGCQSLFSTLERQIGLRRVDYLGCFILVAWLLSPLGGQASLRLLSTKPFVRTYDSTLLYYPIEGYPRNTALSIEKKNGSGSPFFAPLFVTAIQTSRNRMTSPMDIFGNVRIPDIDTLNASSSQVASGSWRPVKNETGLRFTSVFGLPIAGLPMSGNASFNLISHYWAIKCNANSEYWMAEPWSRVYPNTTRLSEVKPLSPSFDIVVDDENSTDKEILFHYQSRTGASLKTPSIISLPCSAAPRVVESRIFCRSMACSCQAMRSVSRGAADVWQDLDPIAVFKAISNRLPGADMSVTQDIEYGSELVERWILNPNLDLASLAKGWLDLSYFEAEVFRQRFQMTINTFWDATIGSLVRMSSLTKEQVTSMGEEWNSTTAHVAEYEELRYICDITLAVITMIISVILLVAANLSLLLGITTKTPDILGFVSVSARDNPFFKRSTISHLSGLETARELCNVRVRIGDVKGEGEVGHIALATMDAAPQKLSWTRLYD